MSKPESNHAPEVDFLHQRIEELEFALQQLKDSRSWRITAPLRLSKLIFNYLRAWTKWLPYSLTADSDSQRGEGVVRGPGGVLPIGWTTLSLATPAGACDYLLYVDAGDGFDEQLRFSLNFTKQPELILKLPRLVRAMRLDAVKPTSKASSSTLQVRQRSSLWAWLCLNRQQRIDCRSRWELNRRYSAWAKRHDTPCAQEIAEASEQSQHFEYRPLISVLMPTYNTPERWLRRAIETVMAQSYQNWELCIADDASKRPSVGPLLEQYAALDSRIRVVRRLTNGHICEASNTALEMARGEFVALMDHDDELSPNALFEVAKALNKNRTFDLIYSDEDRIDGLGHRADPYRKPDWQPELLLEKNFVSHLGVYRTELVRKLGGFRKGFEGSQDWDLALRVSEVTAPERIYHIAKVLYHWRLQPGSVSYDPSTFERARLAGQKAVDEYNQRLLRGKHAVG